MSSNQETQNRECLWCAEPIEGRADKQFCSSACKARHHRDTPQDEPAERHLPAITTRLKTPVTPIRYVEPVDEDEDEDEDTDENWQVAYEREQQATRDQEKAGRLHQIYNRQATQFLKQEDLAYSW